MLFNRLGYLPGLSEILSLSELIPSQMLPYNSITLTLIGLGYKKEIQ